MKIEAKIKKNYENTGRDKGMTRREVGYKM